MLTEIYSYAVEKKNEILQKIDLRHFTESLDKAREMWISYEPARNDITIAGIDSSWNFVPYQGFFLYAIEGVSILRDNSFLVSPRFAVNVGTLQAEEGHEIVYNPRLQLESVGMEYEYQLAIESVGKVDCVLIDGSVLARFYDRRLKKPVKLYEHAQELMAKNNVIFVSKTSESDAVLSGMVGDLFYFNRASTSAGYSKPYFDNVGVSVFYVRLANFCPCIKVEVPSRISETDGEQIMNVLGCQYFDGYPYVLRLAHERCKVGDEDMKRLAEVLGLNIEIGGRQVLGE